MKRPIIENEEARLNALRNLQLLDTPPSESFDRITRLSGRLLGAPVSTISLTDGDRQWFKSIVGAALVEIPRAEAPCSYAIHDDEVFVVPDLLEDSRFNTGVMANAGIRFYAGAPLITQSGYGLGTLCVLDTKPRLLAEDERQVLVDLAAMVMAQIELQNTIGQIDPSTGFPNEFRLFQDLEDDARHNPAQNRLGVLIELVSPQQINEGLRTLGAIYVEELVRATTEIIRAAVGKETRIYHIGRTRCLMILDEAGGASWPTLADELDRRLREMTIYSGIPVTPNPAMGIHTFRLGELAPRDLLRRLFGAAADARETGQLFATYNEIDDQVHARGFEVLSGLQAALDGQGELTLNYQPVVDLKSGRCESAEALLRWRHPVLGDVPPGEFIILAEGTALMRPLTEWVFDTAASQIAAWVQSGEAVRVSVNISARNLEETDFTRRVAAILDKHRIQASGIQLEFTESAVVTQIPRARDQLAALTDLGLNIVIDDFGTGYNGLSYLREFPASAIKIDQSFIKNLATDERDRKLVRTMIAMAHDLGYRVVAEGVEDRTAYELLREWGCDAAQGYYIARPLSVAALTAWLETAGEPKV
jgi:EAL domain-containing protein (putative c-di-GMP-specific phosphodiesterase class I)/GAF domain-containing protein